MLLLFYLSKDKGKGYNGKKQVIIVNCWNIGVNDKSFFNLPIGRNGWRCGVKGFFSEI